MIEGKPGKNNPKAQDSEKYYKRGFVLLLAHEFWDLDFFFSARVTIKIVSIANRSSLY